MQHDGNLHDMNTIIPNPDLSRSQIIHNLELLSDWLRVKFPDERIELVVVGGAALVLLGHKNQTRDIDVLRPHPLPESLRQGIREVANHACNPSVEKHLEDIKAIRPSAGELKLAVEFCLKRDPHRTNRQDLAAIVRKLGFDPDEIY